ncbi:MAG TPA: hypothetical protein VHQ23_09925 [Ilumatobacteraceae bacterium]|jgi:hypothetical protein|nr:hypothetical protein [Ilumatobacteraceae bacterium]
MSVALLVACSGASPTTVRRELGVGDIAGEYQLTHIGNEPLPAMADPGRVTVFSGHLALLDNLRFTQVTSEEVCIIGRCTSASDTSQGTWEILENGTLYFDDDRGYSCPPPRVVADGRSIRFYTATDTTLGFVYDRQ